MQPTLPRLGPPGYLPEGTHLSGQSGKTRTPLSLIVRWVVGSHGQVRQCIPFFRRQCGLIEHTMHITASAIGICRVAGPQNKPKTLDKPPIVSVYK